MAAGLIGRPSIVQIPLNLDIIRIPVKVRKQNIGERQLICLYSVSSQIKHIYGEKHAIIRLNRGFEINFIEPLKSINMKIFLGNMTGEKFALNVHGEYNSNKGYPE